MIKKEKANAEAAKALELSAALEEYRTHPEEISQELEVEFCPSINDPTEDQHSSETLNIQITIRNGKISVSDLYEQLKDRRTFYIPSMCTYYSDNHGCFVYCGLLPPREDYWIPYEDVKEKLLLRCRHAAFPSGDTHVPSKVEKRTRKGGEIEPKKVKKRGGGRANERTISEVISKVAEWQHALTHSIPGFHRMTRESAAEHVGIPKKTLEDYHQQLKLGRDLQFDFNQHGHLPVGILRRYNRESGSKVKSMTGQSNSEAP